MREQKVEGERDVCAHECIPIEGSPKIHWAERGRNGWTVLNDERDQRHAEGMRRGLSKQRHPHQSI